MYRHIIMKTLQITLLITGLLFPMTSRSQVILDDPPEMRGIGVEEHYGETVPLDLTFTNSEGRTVRFGDYFRENKPVLFVLAYYECEMLCNLVLNSLSNGIQQVNLQPGEDYQIVTVSIDPDETSELAAGKQFRYIDSLGDKVKSGGWEFLVGNAPQIAQLADAVGFQYYYIEDKDEYAHPAVAFVLTPEGRISRYHYGLDIKARDLRLSLLEASNGKIGNTIDKIILYCFHYDPDARGYVLFAQNVMRAGGVVIVVFLGVFVGSLLAKERARKTRQAAHVS
jgi:protein SCO1